MRGERLLRLAVVSLGLMQTPSSGILPPDNVKTEGECSGGQETAYRVRNRGYGVTIVTPEINQNGINERNKVTDIAPFKVYQQYGGYGIIDPIDTTEISPLSDSWRSARLSASGIAISYINGKNNPTIFRTRNYADLTEDPDSLFCYEDATGKVYRKPRSQR